jgi:PAS domain S-box-containing protein
MPTTDDPAAVHPTLRHLEQLMAQLLDGVILVDPAGTILSANDAALRMHGVREIAALGGTAEGYAARFSLRSQEHRELKHREYPLFRLLAGESFPDLIVEVAPAGETETRWVHQVRDVVMDEDGGEPDYLALVISDVSARFDAEARFNAMFRSNPAPAIVVGQQDERIMQVNPGFLALTGFAPDQLVGRKLFALDLLDGLPRPAMIRERLEAGEVVPQTEAELLTAGGARRLVLFAGQPIDVTDTDALLLTFADLEPRRQAQDELAAAERHLSAVFEMAPAAMAVTDDGDHRIVRANAAFRLLTGYEQDEILGRTMDELSFASDADHHADIADRDPAAQDSPRDREARLSRKDGTAVDILLSAEKISLEGASCTLRLYQDVTERRRSEQELAGAIDAVMKDTTWLSRSILDKLAMLRRPTDSAPIVDLSSREREVLDLICDDLDDGAIAERLGLSRNTVRNHVARIYAKIGVNRRSGAVVWGQARGMGGGAGR